MDRRHPFLTLDRRQLDDMLRSVFPGRQLELFEPISGGRCNSNYRIVLRGEPRPYFLRVYSRGRDVARKEIALYELLKGRVPVPEVVYASTPGDGQGLQYAIFHWLPLPTLGDVLPAMSGADAAAIGRSAGETLGRIASVRFERPGDLGPDLSIAPWPDSGEGAFIEFVRGCLEDGLAGERLGPELTASVWELVSREGHRLRDEGHVSCLVHSDFNPTNLMVAAGDGPPRIGAVVDWEFAHSGSPLMDFGNLMRDHRNLPAGFAGPFVEAFQAEWGLLPEDWLARVKLIDLTAHLDFLQLEEDRGEIHRQALATIERTVTQWSSYFPW